MSILGREPVRWIGIIASCVLAVLTILTGEGIITDATSGDLTDTVHSLEQILLIFVPIIAAEIARRQVTPVADPKLEAGTRVTVLAPDGTDHLTVL